MPTDDDSTYEDDDGEIGVGKHAIGRPGGCNLCNQKAATIASLEAQLVEARWAAEHFKSMYEAGRQFRDLQADQHATCHEQRTLAEMRAAGYRAALESVKLLLSNRGYLEMHSYVTDALAADTGSVLSAIHRLWEVCLGIGDFDLDDAMSNPAFLLLGLKKPN